jgi:hypothetical protein
MGRFTDSRRPGVPIIRMARHCLSRHETPRRIIGWESQKPLSITGLLLALLLSMATGGCDGESPSATRETQPATSAGSTTPSTEPRSTGPPSTAPPSNVVRITVPSDGSSVPMITDVEGTSPKLPEGHQLWVVVKPASAAGFWPQAGPIPLQPDGRWSVTAEIGEKADVGMEFNIIAVVATGKQARDALAQYLRGCEQGACEPLYGALPIGAVRQHQITVRRS